MKRKSFLKQIKESKTNETVFVPIFLTQSEVKEIFTTMNQRKISEPTAHQNKDKSL